MKIPLEVETHDECIVCKVKDSPMLNVDDAFICFDCILEAFSAFYHREVLKNVITL